MEKSYRSAVFDLCKMLLNNREAGRIRTIINDMTVVETDDDSNIIKRPSHGDLAYIGSQQRIQFLGYLLADESVEEININSSFHVTHMKTEERSIIEEAYKAIRLFFDLCIDEVKEKYPKASIMLDPYFLYNYPKETDGVVSFLSKDDFQECIEAFKRGKVYKKLISNDALIFWEIVDESILYQIVALQKKQFTDDLKYTSEETKSYFKKITMGSVIDSADVMMAYSIYCYALRSALEIAAQMIFEAIMGEDMTVMNENNIIDITDHHVDIVYEKYVVLIQDTLLGLSRRTGSLALLVCDPTEVSKIKEFGVIVALTVSFNYEFGNTSKVTIVTVDDELNEIHRFTDAIIETSLGMNNVVH